MPNDNDSQIKRNIDATTEVAISDLVELTKISRQTIATKLDALDLPFSKGDRGKRFYNLAELLKKSLQLSVSNDKALDDDKKRLAKAKADIAELELGRMNGELIATDAAIQAISEEYQVIRAQLNNLGRMTALKLAQSVDATECAAIVDKAVEEILATLQSDNAQTLSALGETQHQIQNENEEKENATDDSDATLAE